MDPLGTLSLPLVGEDMRRFEPLLRESIVIGDPFLDQVTTHLLGAGGKRLRPLLAIASATGGLREATEDDLLGGVALELMHLASLYHDDVMDEAAIRRSTESVNARYGNLVAIVAGDFLMARSAAIAADLGTEVASLLARTLALLTRGQVSEVRTSFSVDRSLEDYYEAISGKTAALMASACRVGGLTAQVGDAQLDALTRYGEALGMVFQIRDDILDVVAVDGQLGKPAGQDLAEGIYTLPVIVALSEAGSGEALRSILGGPLDDDARERARQIVASSNGVDAAYAAADRYIGEAKSAASELSSDALAEGFSALAGTLVLGLPAA
jgi:heptaprenyl diphosphate synthase